MQINQQISKKMLPSEEALWRVKLARKLIQSYNFPRGKDRLYLILASVLKIPQNLIVNLDHNLKFYCDLNEYLQRWIFCNNEEADEDFVAMRRILKVGDSFVDIGANIGIFSLLGASCVGESGKVYAVEAVPFIQKKLSENIKLNKIENIEIVPYAIGEKNGEVSFFLSNNGNNGASSLSANTPNGEHLKVMARTFDSLIEDGTIARCDVLKMDIEGAEILALQGMKKLFEVTPPRAVMIEVGETLLANFSASPKDIINLFLQYKYVWHRATSNGLEPLTDLNVKGFQNLWAILSK